MERPGKVVPPQTLYQGFLEVLQLVRHPARPAGILHRGLWRGRGGLGHHVRQGGAFKVLVQQGGLADTFSRAVVLVQHTTGQPNQRAEIRGTTRQEDGINQ